MSDDRHQDHGRSALHRELQEASRLAAAGRIAVAQNLARVYDEVLEAPLPEELSALVRRLEAQEAGRH
jgi:hypothetical protein